MVSVECNAILVVKGQSLFYLECFDALTAGFDSRVKGQGSNIKVIGLIVIFCERRGAILNFFERGQVLFFLRGERRFYKFFERRDKSTFSYFFDEVF